jgi:hypothetical protein
MHIKPAVGPLEGRILRNVFCFCVLAALQCSAAFADSGGSDWSTSYGFPGAGKHQTNMSQADMIAKRESGYYDGLGKSEVYNISTTSIGTMTTTTNTVNGNSNNVAADSLSSGSMDASVKIQSLVSSTLSQNKSD